MKFFSTSCCLLLLSLPVVVLTDSQTTDPCEDADRLRNLSDTDYHAEFYQDSIEKLYTVLDAYIECDRSKRDLAGVHRSIARSFAVLDSLERSIEHLDEALSLYRGCEDEEFFLGETHRERGRVYCRFGKHEECLAEEDTAIALHGRAGSPRTYVARCYEVKGEAFLGLGQHEESIASYDDARMLFREFRKPDIFESSVFIEFELSSIPSRSRIVSATLCLFYYEWHDNDPALRDLTLYRITEGWQESAITHGTEPAVVPYPTGRSVVPVDSGWMKWDVNEDVQSYVDGRGGDCGWKIMDENRWMAYNIPQIFFYSRENRGSGRIPFLEVEYSNSQLTETLFPTAKTILHPIADATTHMPTPTANHGFGPYLLVRNRYGASALDVQEARCQMGKGQALRSLGRHEEAKHCYRRALELLEKIRKGSERDRARCYTSIGKVYFEVGEYEECMERQRSALAIYRQIMGSQREQGDCYQYLGDAFRALDDYQRSMDHYELALSFYEELEGTERTIGVCHQKIGLAEADAGRAKRAVKRYRKALEIFSSLSGTAAEQGDCHRMIGEAYLEMGKKKEGYGSLRAAIERYKEAEGTDRELAQCYLSLALAYKDSESGKTLARAAEDFANSVFYTERHRNMGYTQETRMELFKEIAQVYPAVVSFLLRCARRGWCPAETTFTRWISSRDRRLGCMEAALHFAEVGKARALVEVLSEKIPQVSDPEALLLLRKERAVVAEISAIQSRLGMMSDDDEERPGVERRLQEKETERRQIGFELMRTTIGKYRSPRFETVAAIRGKLDEETGIIEYVVTEESTFLFVVTGCSLRQWAIPIHRGLPPDLEAADPELDWRLEERFLQDPASVGLKGLVRLYRNRMVNLALDRIEERIDKRNHIAVGSYLCDLLLPEEARGVLRADGVKRLIVIPDDVIHLLPLDALITEVEEGVERLDYHHCEFLLHEYILSYVSSIAVLCVIEEQRGDRQERATKDFLGVADPIVSEDDERLEHRAVLKSRSSSSTQRRNTRFQFRRIPGTEREAIRIARLFGDPMVFRESLSGVEIPAWNVCVFSGLAASEEVLRRLPLVEYRHLFFATHAHADEKNPILSALVLTCKVGPDGYEPHHLTAMEVFGLRLNADLVTLAACETAVGPCVPGEGMVGFVTAFFHAGASSVVATLWPVATDQTAELMEDFYSCLIEGEGKAEALRSAKLKMLAEGDPDPSFWAGFLLYGEP